MVKNNLFLPRLTVRHSVSQHNEYWLKKNYHLYTVHINFTNTVETLEYVGPSVIISKRAGLHHREASLWFTQSVIGSETQLSWASSLNQAQSSLNQSGFNPSLISSRQPNAFPCNGTETFDFKSVPFWCCRPEWSEKTGLPQPNLLYPLP